MNLLRSPFSLLTLDSSSVCVGSCQQRSLKVWRFMWWISTRERRMILFCCHWWGATKRGDLGSCRSLIGYVWHYPELRKASIVLETWECLARFLSGTRSLKPLGKMVTLASHWSFAVKTTLEPRRRYLQVKTSTVSQREAVLGPVSLGWVVDMLAQGHVTRMTLSTKSTSAWSLVKRYFVKMGTTA